MRWTAQDWLLFALAAIFMMLAACAHKPLPSVEYRTVTVAVPVRCAPKLGPEPDYPDTDAKLKAATDDFDWVKRLVAGRLMRIARDAEKSAALAACAGSPSP